MAFLERLDEGLPRLSKQQRKMLLDGAAVAAYHAQKEYPVVQKLVCDDAPQFNWLGQEMMLCWVHDGRRYKKLMPVIAFHRELLDNKFALPLFIDMIRVIVKNTCFF